MLICYKKKLWEIFNYVWARLVDLLLVYRHCMSVLNSYFADAMSWLNELLNQSVGNRETQFFFSLRPKSVIELDTRRTSLQVERVGGSIFDVSETLRSSLTCLDRLNWQFTSSFVKFDVLPGPKVEKH